jgi:LysR family nitrogen assimilation transcriptional regulator
LELRQLRYLVRIVELRSFTKAAEELRISQPTLGEHVRNLEADLGVQLLIRHSRGVEPTEAGLLLAQRGRKILGEVADVQQELRALGRSVTGSVTIAISPGLNEMFSADLIRRCSETLPKVVLNIVEDLSLVLIDRLVQGREAISFALVGGKEATLTKELTALPLAVEQLFLIASPNFPNVPDGPIRFAELVALPLIVLGNAAEGSVNGTIGALAQERGLTPHIICEIRSVSAVKELIEQNVGAAVLPIGTARRGIQSGTLVARPIIDPPVCREISLVSSVRHRPTRAEILVRDALTALVRDEIASGRGLLRLAEDMPATLA